MLQDLQLANTTLANELVRLQSTGGEVRAESASLTAPLLDNLLEYHSVYHAVTTRGTCMRCVHAIA